MMNATLRRKQNAGNPHVAPTRRGSLLYSRLFGRVVAGGSFLSVVLLTFGAPAADVYSDAVISFRANMMKDLNADGKLNSSSELLDSIDPAGTGHSKYERWPTGTNNMFFQKEDVLQASFPGTNSEQVIYFKQPRTEVSRDESAGTVTYEFSPNAIWVSSLGAAVETNYTVFTRVRLDDVWPFKDNKARLFNLGFSYYSTGVGKGLVVGFDGKGSSRGLQVYVGPYYIGENIGILTDRWVDIAVSVEGPPTNTAGNVKIGLVVYQDGKISLAKQYETTFSAASTTKPGTQLLIGSENNNDGNLTCQTTYKTDGTYVSCKQAGTTTDVNNRACCFIGSLSELTLWGRALTMDEMQSVVRMHDGKLWQLGVKNGKSTEFTATAASASAVDPRAVWSDVKAGLSKGEKHCVKFPVRDTLAGQPVLFSYATAESSAGGNIKVSLNDHAIGTAAVAAGAQTANFFIPSGILEESDDNEIQIERTDSGSGSLILDSCWMGGSWRIGYQDKSWDEFCHEGDNWANYYVDDCRFNRLRRVINDNANGNKKDVIHFMVPEETLNGKYRWKLQLSLCWGSTDDTSLALVLNGATIDTRKGGGALNGTTRKYRIDADMLTAGDNTLEIKNLAESGTGYISLDCVWLTMYERRGTVIIIK